MDGEERSHSSQNPLGLVGQPLGGRMKDRFLYNYGDEPNKLAAVIWIDLFLINWKFCWNDGCDYLPFVFLTLAFDPQTN